MYPYKNKRGILILASFLVLFISHFVYAHGGGLDTFGCHHNRKLGGYHCHRGKFAGQSFASKAEMQRALSNEPSVPTKEVIPPLSITAPPIIESGSFCKEHLKYGAPSKEPVLLCRAGYALSHDPDLKVPDWVAYHLTKKKVSGESPRSNDFRADQNLNPGKRAELDDYKGSGYDRGHMAPAGAMKWSGKAMSESFLLSNIAPQIGNRFNRHIWKELEIRVRTWTSEREELYIVTGPIYIGNIITIGANKVAVPTHFYKVIFDPIRFEAIAFVLENKPLETNNLPNFITSIDEIERLTGLDFLSEIEDSAEMLIEGTKQQRLW